MSRFNRVSPSCSGAASGCACWVRTLRRTGLGSRRPWLSWRRRFPTRHPWARSQACRSALRGALAALLGAGPPLPAAPGHFLRAASPGVSGGRSEIAAAADSASPATPSRARPRPLPAAHRARSPSGGVRSTSRSGQPVPVPGGRAGRRCGRPRPAPGAPRPARPRLWLRLLLRLRLRLPAAVSSAHLAAKSCTESLALDPDCPSARRTHTAKDEFGKSSRLLL